MRKIWFYRNYQYFTGGHLKHSHYFHNVSLLPQFNPQLFFAPQTYSEEQRCQMAQLWNDEKNIASQWLPQDRDIIFLAGMDWQFALMQADVKLTMPRLNLIQGVRHADPSQSLFRYLSEPAIRICVSQPVADAINSTGKVCGPVFVIPNGVDIQPAQSVVADKGFSRVQIIGYKRPDFARVLEQKLSSQGIAAEMFLDMQPRKEFIARLDPAAIVVCCPFPEEGFYLTALEAMAKGCFVVVPDCVGNQAYALDGINCLFPDYEIDNVFNSVLHALNLQRSEIEKIRMAGVLTATKHTLANERRAFYELLDNIDHLWQEI